MIISRLCLLYDRLISSGSDIPKPGFTSQNISFCIVINEDGTLHEILDIRNIEGKKVRPTQMQVPDCGGRTSGIKAQLLWDKAEYLLGWANPELTSSMDDPNEEKKRAKKLERINKQHEETKREHARINGIDTMTPLIKFFEHWSPDLITNELSFILNEIGTGFGVFRVRGRKEYLHNDTAFKSWWHENKSLETPGQNTHKQTGRCLITGDTTSIARLHPVIKGVKGAQSSGAGIVSFNRRSFDSYGHEQGLNAPIGQNATFKYTTALNYLLDRDRQNRLQIGDATVVFWTEQPITINECDAEELLAFGLSGTPKGAEDDAQHDRLALTLQNIRNGQTRDLPHHVGFYVLGLSPNASRLSVRFWFESNLKDLLNRVAKHQSELDIIRGPKDRQHLPCWLLLQQTAREPKDIPPLLGGSLLRSILQGIPYPIAFLSTVMRRIRADRDIRHPRAAIIKAFLNRNYHKEIPVMLDPDRPEPAYQLGRLFATLEKAQHDALPSVNATIKDRYFSAASTTPASVFPRLIRGSQHHLHKLEGGIKVNAEKRIQSIIEHLNDFPQHLNLVGQGLFAIGYYHQRQALYTKSTASDQSESAA